MKPTYTLHKLSEGYIVCSNEQIEKGSIVLETLIDGKKELFEIHTLNDIDLERQVKVIAQQDQIDFSALSEEEQKEIGWFDVEKLAYNYSFATQSDPNWGTTILSLIKGFQKAQELLSDRLFTLEEARHFFNEGLLVPNKDIQNADNIFNQVVQSLSQKSWKVEVEVELNLNGRNGLERASFIPKLTNGKIKILNIL